MVAIGFYGGFLQVGAGFLIMAVLYHVMGAPLVRVNFHKVIVILFCTVPAVLISFLSENVTCLDFASFYLLVEDYCKLDLTGPKRRPCN